MQKTFILLAFTLSICFSHSFGQENYPVYPFNQTIELDGMPNEPVWDKISYSSNLIALKEEKALRFNTRFKLFSNKEKLFILVELKGQTLAEIQKNESSFSYEKKTFPTDHLVFFLSSRPEGDDHFRILVDFHGNIADCAYPAKAGHGFPYGAKVNYDWSSKSKCAFSQGKDGNIYLEMEMSVKSMNLQKNLFSGFGFNLIRKAFYLDEKNNRRSEESSWANINGQSWDTQKFGLIKGPLYQEPINFTKVDLKNLDQMTNGMTALMKSLDIYYKAINEYEYHIPEGAEINGDIGNFDHVPIPQYPIKADGYFRFYNSFKYEPYKKLGNHIINKLYQGVIETTDARNKNYLVWNNLRSTDGKVYGYGSGRKMSMFLSRAHVSFNQSSNEFNLKGVVFQDGLGQGFIDLSEIKDTLDTEIASKIKMTIYFTLEFLHQDHILIDNGTEYYWRIDSFKPYVPQPYKGKLEKSDWPFLGQDIILMYIALAQFDTSFSKYFDESMFKFSDFYMKNRLSVSDKKGPHAPHNIYKLDLRMLTLAEFGVKNKIKEFVKLNDWLQENLPGLYQEIPKVEYSCNGATNNSWSTQGVLEIYRQLGMKTEFKRFWDLSFTQSMKPTGLFQGHQILPMNFSSYPIYFDYAKKALASGMFTEEEFVEVCKKMFFFYGNPQIHRNNLLYAVDLEKEHRSRPMWANTPYDCYIEGVLPEGIYANASSQASYVVYGDYSANEFFETPEEHVRYGYSIKYRQYTAPFQYHSDRYSYGKAESLCLAKMEKINFNLSDLEENKTVKVNFKTSSTIKGLPVFGSLDVTNILFQDDTATKPTNLKLDKITKNDEVIPHRCYTVFEYDRILSKKDKAKVVFGLWNDTENQEVEIKLHFKEKVIRNYFTEVEK